MIYTFLLAIVIVLGIIFAPEITILGIIFAVGATWVMKK